MDVNEVCRQLIDKLGGRDNIRSNDACVTRLRVGVCDLSRVDVDAIKALDGVLGIVASDTVQIVFGPGVVNQVLDTFCAMTGIARGDGSTGPEAPVAHPTAQKSRAVPAGGALGASRDMLKHVANVFVPLLPGIIAAGLINGIMNEVTVTTGGAYSGLWWYECLRTLGWAMFTYLPIFAGYNAAREFGGSPVLGGIAGALCVANQAMPLLAGNGGTQPILPMTGAVYNPSSGGLLAALLAGALFAWLERTFRKLVPAVLDTFVTPLLVLVVGSVALVAVLQPIGAALTQGVYTVMSFAYNRMGVVGGYVLAAGFLPLVSVGLHQALTPIHVMLNDPAGPTGGVNYLLPVLMMAGGGQVGAGIALYLKSQNARLKRYVRDSIPVAVLGVGEPLMYAVTLPLGRPFVTACLGAGVGGAVATLFHLGAVTQGASGLFGLLIMQVGQQVPYVVALLFSYAGGFALTYLFGVDEARINEVYGTTD